MSVSERGAMADRITKLQRWLDLIAFLAGRRFPVAVDQVMDGVPWYAARWDRDDDRAMESTRRTFERDKDELRDAGIPIESVEYVVEGRSSTGYVLRDRDFYLPYLRLVSESVEPAGRVPDASPAGTFEIRDEELSAAVAGLQTMAKVPGFPLAAEARSALRKLTFDLAPDALRDEPVLFLQPPDALDVKERLAALSDALMRRKRVTFRYHGIYRGEATDRRVRPYGLLFHHGHWYLIGHDEDRDALRVFRAGRMETVTVNPSGPHTPDYQVPGDFDLRAYGHRQPWELGGESGGASGGEEEEPLTAQVRFHFPRSLWAERNHLGTPVTKESDGSQVRSFGLHQTDPFLRWILSLEGEAVIEAPPELVSGFQDLRSRVAALYAGGGDA
jgi:predicted DNA-binding transcriptional regulator YafY